MNYKRGPLYLLALTLVTAACERNEAVALSEPQTTITAPANASIADSAPGSGLRPAAGSYPQRYLSNIAPLIVNCMNDLGWEATYDPRLGALLAEVPPSQVMERDGAMSFCVAGSRNYRGTYAE